MEHARPVSGAEPGDDELVRRTLGGDHEAFGIIWDRHVQSIFSYSYHCLGHRQRAEDVTGETFRRALTYLHTYRKQGFRSWLFTIARNAVKDNRSTNPAILPLEILDDRCQGAVPKSVLDRIVIAEVLAILTPGEREVVEFRLAGLSPAEIAQALDRSRSSVDMSYSRAIARLRSCKRKLDEHAGGKTDA